MSFNCAFCRKSCLSLHGLQSHIPVKHRKKQSFQAKQVLWPFKIVFHPNLNAIPCTEYGSALSPGASPPPRAPIDAMSSNPWSPFDGRLSFEFAYHHFTELQSSGAQINRALDLWLAAVIQAKGDLGSVPWRSAVEMYTTIDSIREGSVSWRTVKFRYTGPFPAGVPPRWMTEEYELCFRDPHHVLLDQISSPDLRHHFNYVPYKQFNQTQERVWSNLMSGEWAWNKATKIVNQNPSTDGAMLVPIIVGSDKTTVSVATGHQEFHPVYIGAGNITNTMRRLHLIGIEPVALLPIPKTSWKHRKRQEYQTFCRQLYHTCLTRIFSSLKPTMTTPEIARCPDGYFRRIIFSLGPYIADYPEQVWLSGIVQNWCATCEATPENLDEPDAGLRSHEKTDILIQDFDPTIIWDNYGIRDDVVPFTYHFPRADIHKLLTPDLLHQVIKGSFKDHLVTWVEEYLIVKHGQTNALHYIQEIDRRISAVPAFPGLRCFPDGRDFSQWTGDDSKALMKVYLAAIDGLVPPEMVACISKFVECCYIVRRNAITSFDLEQYKRHLVQFHRLRTVFIETGVRTSISLPRQHSLTHFVDKIELFRSPNGVCSSITESKHIRAMMRTISRLNKLVSIRRVFQNRAMLDSSTSGYATALATGSPLPIRPFGAGNGNSKSSDMESHHNDPDDDSDDDGGPSSSPYALAQVTLASKSAPRYPKFLSNLAKYIEQPGFPTALRRFVFAQRHPTSDGFPPILPEFSSKISVFHSAIASFYAPSDLCGAGGMYQEHIRANPSCAGKPQFDTVFITVADAGSEEEHALRGMLIAQVLLFFSFNDPLLQKEIPCALINWFIPKSDKLDPITGMWVFEPKIEEGKQPLEVIYLDTIVRGAHLLPKYGSGFLPENFSYVDALNAFKAYFVNHFVDYHTHELIKGGRD
ncbi:hypothetical protein M378DRAFT_188432 [Amanita muscaria Koide BX008]|uniref:C2H2-type domain-containing protein n=1 Tax=Amanita muscaria (strain Koide BX008) TaxID=946122 RepID=A0A0C2WL92_AMAMK|nr:hypothetical protein M378DRAFT_188432 [Amanita muscaria Koide BX008]